MDGKLSLGVLCACAGLGACAAADLIPEEIIDPTGGLLDSALPFGTTSGVAVDMLSADLDGVATNQATITFNANGSFSIVLPSGGAPITVSDTAVIIDPPAANLGLLTTSATLAVGDYDIDLHLGEDGLGNDLFILARVEDAFSPSPNTMAFVVFGDETAPASLPTGTAVAYTGGFVSDVFDAAGDPLAQMSGDSTITANFVANTVDLSFVQTGEVTSATFTGTTIPVVGAQYTGAITSTGGGTNYVGTVLGAFYGPAGEATAGTFHADDAIAGTEIVGGFTGFR